MSIRTSHQVIASRQRVNNYHPSGAIAAHILESTIAFESSEKVMQVQAGNAAQVGRLMVEEGQRIWIVKSKFADRYYVVVDGKCSSFDDRVSAACIAQVQAHALQAA